MSSIAVQSRTLFPTPSQETVPPVLFDPVATTITVAELIQQAVAKQIAELQQQQYLKAVEALRTIEQHYLAAGEISAQERPGTTGLPTHGADGWEEIAAAVKQAWRAFERRAYIVVIDGNIARSLDEEITCWQDHKVTFLRLVPLVGG